MRVAEVFVAVAVDAFLKQKMLRYGPEEPTAVYPELLLTCSKS